MSIYFQCSLTLETINSLVNSSRQNIYHISKDLSSVNGRMLITEAGRLTFYSNWFAEDSWGLNTPKYAKKLISVDDIKSGNYDLVVAHCDIPLLDYKTAAFDNDNSRGWDNQCKNIANYITSEKFEIYLVPFESDSESIQQQLVSFFIPNNNHRKTGMKCRRYDIYAISEGFLKLDNVKQILMSYGAIKYSQNIVKGGGDLVCN
jgi:hypothetical protein